MDVVVNSDCQFSLNPEFVINGHGDYYQNIFKCLGYADGEPVGDLLRAHYGLQGHWLVATPIFWQATHNDAMLLACDSALNVTEDEARGLFEIVTNFAAGEGMRTHFHDAYTWLLQCDDKPPITANPPHRMLHQSLFPHLKTIDKTLFWQRFITEVQMLLNGQSKVNGVWIWGAGSLPLPSNRLILVNSQETHDLAQRLSTKTDYVKNTPPTQNALLLFDSLNQDEWMSLQTELSHYAVNWYWNNLAYSSKPKSWFSRLMKRVR